MMLELNDDEAAQLAVTLRRTVTSATHGAENAGPEKGAQLGRVARTLGGVLERLERRPLPTPATTAATYWIMLSSEGAAAVMTHRAEEREGLQEDGHTVADSARFDTHEQAIAWFKRWTEARFGKLVPV